MNDQPIKKPRSESLGKNDQRNDNLSVALLTDQPMHCYENPCAGLDSTDKDFADWKKVIEQRLAVISTGFEPFSKAIEQVKDSCQFFEHYQTEIRSKFLMCIEQLKKEVDQKNSEISNLKHRLKIYRGFAESVDNELIQRVNDVKKSANKGQTLNYTALEKKERNLNEILKLTKTQQLEKEVYQKNSESSDLKQERQYILALQGKKGDAENVGKGKPQQAHEFKENVAKQQILKKEEKKENEEIVAFPDQSKKAMTAEQKKLMIREILALVKKDKESGLR